MYNQIQELRVPCVVRPLDFNDLSTRNGRVPKTRRGCTVSGVDIIYTHSSFPNFHRGVLSVW